MKSSKSIDQQSTTDLVFPSRWMKMKISLRMSSTEILCQHLSWWVSQIRNFNPIDVDELVQIFSISDVWRIEEKFSPLLLLLLLRARRSPLCQCSIFFARFCLSNRHLEHYCVTSSIVNQKNRMRDTLAEEEEIEWYTSRQLSSLSSPFSFFSPPSFGVFSSILPRREEKNDDCVDNERYSSEQKISVDSMLKDAFHLRIVGLSSHLSSDVRRLDRNVIERRTRLIDDLLLPFQRQNQWLCRTTPSTFSSFTNISFDFTRIRRRIRSDFSLRSSLCKRSFSSFPPPKISLNSLIRLALPFCLEFPRQSSWRVMVRE